ncbi:MAG: BspA family leucine-rich repeat surface protein [Clostridia bacterium]|nr:BspA family leucine-rich repeat surface protein [Clostridia bacterium]
MKNKSKIAIILTLLFVLGISFIVYAASVGDEIDITYHCGEDGNFSTGEDTNVVTYEIKTTPGIKYSHTPNIDNDGVATETYDEPYKQTDIVTITGASYLDVDIWYSTENRGGTMVYTPLDCVEVTADFDMDFTDIGTDDTDPDALETDNARYDGVTLYLYGGCASTKESAYHMENIRCNGDTVKFYFESDYDDPDTYYGYYAIVTGYDTLGNVIELNVLDPKTNNYEEPTAIDSDYEFSSWNKNSDGSGTEFDDKIEVDITSISDMDVYAQYEKNYPHGTSDECIWEIIDGKLIIRPTDGDSGCLAEADGDYPWEEYFRDIVEVEIKPGVATGYDASGLFNMLINCVTFDVSNLDTSNCENMNSMFRFCQSATSIDVSDFDVTWVENMSEMFYGCSSLETIDISEWDTSWEFLTDTQAMFKECTSLESIIGLDTFYTTEVTDMACMFDGCESLTSVDLSNFSTTNVTCFEYMFYGCKSLTSIDISTFDFSSIPESDEHHHGGTIHYSGDYEEDGEEYSGGPDLGFTAVFAGCSSLTEFIVNNDTFADIKVMNNLFRDCQFTEFDLSGITITNMQNAENMFRDCTELTSLDISDFDTRNATNLHNMFKNCNSLQSIKLGEDFTFLGDSIDEESKQAILPTPPTNKNYSGKWMNIDKQELGFYTATELRDSYTSTMSGTWVWAPQTNQFFEITWVDDNGDFLYSGEFMSGDMPVYSGDNPTKSGDDNYDYVFAGWDPELAEVSGDATYTATYDRTEVYTVTFDSKEGTEIAPIKRVHSGDLIQKPEDPTKGEQGTHVFRGWYRDDGVYEQEFNFQEDKITSNLTLYAKWEVNTNVYVYNKTTGRSGQLAEECGYVGYANSTHKYPNFIARNPEGVTCTLLATTGEGYHFVEWRKDSPTSGDVVSTEETLDYPAVSGVTYYAVFEQIVFPVRLMAIDSADGSTLAGATIKLRKSGQSNATTVVTTLDVSEVNLPAGNYVFDVYDAPLGYAFAEDTNFTISSSGDITTSGDSTVDQSGIILVAEFNKTVVKFICVDEVDDSVVEGVTVRLLDSGELIDEWVSTSDQYVIEGLKTYTDSMGYPDYKILVTNVPSGYEAPEFAYLVIYYDGDIYAGDPASTSGDLVIIKLPKEIQYISNIEATLTVPEAGTVVTVDDGDDSQNPYPEIIIPSGEMYMLDDGSGEYLYGYWYCDEDGEEIFSGEMIGGETYYAVFYIRPTQAWYVFDEDEDVNVTINSGDIEVVDSYVSDGLAYPYIRITVKVTIPLKMYTITFVNDDDTFISSGDYAEGTASGDIALPRDPMKSGDAEWTYEFEKWTPDIVAVTEDATYKAQYIKTKNKYSVVFKNEDGTVLQSGDVEYGVTPEYSGDTPTKSGDAEYTYTFSTWDPEIAPVSGDIVYTATYSGELNRYTVTFVDEDDTFISSGDYAYGTESGDIAQPRNPMKSGDAEWTYEFEKWTPDIVNVTEDATYKAQYTKSKNKYSVVFKNEDGTVLQSGDVEYGVTPEYSGDTPTKSGDAEYTYTFSAWDPEIAPVSGDVVYTAVFSGDLNMYTVTFVDDDGTVLESGEYAYGTLAEEIARPRNPADKEDKEYKYKFDKWTPAIDDVVDDATYTATYTKTKKSSSGTSSGGGATTPSEFKITTKPDENVEITPMNPTVKKNANQEFTFKPKDGFEIADVIVDGKSVGAVDKYTFENVTSKHTIEIKTRKSGPWSNADDWAKEELQEAIERDLIPAILNGKDFTHAVTRLEFCAITTKLYEYLDGKEIVPSGEFPFVDTDETIIKKAYTVGITVGTSETTFSPERLIPREQMATMISRCLAKLGIDVKVDLDTVQRFSDDGEMHDWSREPIYFMAQKEIIKGVGNNRFNVSGNAKIQEALAIILRSAKVYGK